MQEGTRIYEPYTFVEINVLGRKYKDGFNPQAGRGGNTLDLCLKNCVSPDGESRRSHSWASYSEAGDKEQICKDTVFFLFAFLFQNSH